MHNNDHYYINRQCVNSIKIFEDVDNQYAQPDVLHELKTPLRQTKSTEKKICAIFNSNMTETKFLNQ